MVALKRRALLIHDLEASPFKEIHIRVREHIRSELAVLWFFVTIFFGVLNLESPNLSF